MQAEHSSPASYNPGLDLVSMLSATTLGLEVQ